MMTIGTKLQSVRDCECTLLHKQAKQQTNNVASPIYTPFSVQIVTPVYVLETLITLLLIYMLVLESYYAYRMHLKQTK